MSSSTSLSSLLWLTLLGTLILVICLFPEAVNAQDDRILGRAIEVEADIVPKQQLSAAERYATLLAWGRENGAIANFELREVEPHNWGAFANKDLAPNEPLVKVPFTLTINTTFAIENGPLPNRAKWSFPFEALSVLLMQWRATDGGFWEPYVRALPHDLSSIPLTWPDETINQLNGTSIYATLANSPNQFEEAFQKLLDDLESQTMATGRHPSIPLQALTIENYMECHILVASRAWGIAGNNGNDREVMLVPLADMLNHDDSAALGSTGAEGFEIVANGPLAKGAEAFTNYGVKSAGEMLLAYGFVPQRGEGQDFVGIRLVRGPITSKTYQQALTRFNLNADQVNIDGLELNPNTMKILRGAMLGESNIDNLVPLVEDKAISLDNEYFVCRALNRIIRSSIDAMEGSEVYDQRTLARTDLAPRDRMAVQVRSIERNILSKQLKLLAKYWDSILLTGTLAGGIAVDPYAVTVTKPR